MTLPDALDANRPIILDPLGSELGILHEMDEDEYYEEEEGNQVNVLEATPGSFLGDGLNLHPGLSPGALSAAETEESDDDDSDGSSTYTSPDEDEDPVNNIPPLTFSDLYRSKIPPAREPSFERPEIPRSIITFKEINLKKRPISIQPNTVIPPIEAAAFFEMVHGQKFREYMFSEEELEYFPIIPFTNESLASKIDVLSEQIEKGYPQAWYQRAKTYAAAKRFDLAINDINMYLKLGKLPGFLLYLH